MPSAQLQPIAPSGAESAPSASQRDALARSRARRGSGGAAGRATGRRRRRARRRRPQGWTRRRGPTRPIADACAGAGGRRAAGGRQRDVRRTRGCSDRCARGERGAQRTPRRVPRRRSATRDALAAELEAARQALAEHAVSGPRAARRRSRRRSRTPSGRREDAEARAEETIDERDAPIAQLEAREARGQGMQAAVDARLEVIDAKRNRTVQALKEAETRAEEADARARRAGRCSSSEALQSASASSDAATRRASGLDRRGAESTPKWPRGSAEAAARGGGRADPCALELQIFERDRERPGSRRRADRRCSTRRPRGRQAASQRRAAPVRDDDEDHDRRRCRRADRSVGRRRAGAVRPQAGGEQHRRRCVAVVRTSRRSPAAAERSCGRWLEPHSQRRALALPRRAAVHPGPTKPPSRPSSTATARPERILSRRAFCLLSGQEAKGRRCRASRRPSITNLIARPDKTARPAAAPGRVPRLRAKAGAAPIEAPVPRPADFRAVEEFLQLLARAVRQFHTYPATSPLCTDAISACHKVLRVARRARSAGLPRHPARAHRRRHRDRRRHDRRARGRPPAAPRARGGARHRPHRLAARPVAILHRRSCAATISSRPRPRSRSCSPSTGSRRSRRTWRTGRRCSRSARRAAVAQRSGRARAAPPGPDRRGRAGQLPVSARQGVGPARPVRDLRHDLARGSRHPRRRPGRHRRDAPAAHRRRGGGRIARRRASAEVQRRRDAARGPRPAAGARHVLEAGARGPRSRAGAADGSRSGERSCRACSMARADGAVLRDFPNVDLAESLCLLMDLETAAPELLDDRARSASTCRRIGGRKWRR